MCKLVVREDPMESNFLVGHTKFLLIFFFFHALHSTSATTTTTMLKRKQRLFLQGIFLRLSFKRNDRKEMQEINSLHFLMTQTHFFSFFLSQKKHIMHALKHTST